MFRVDLFGYPLPPPAEGASNFYYGDEAWHASTAAQSGKGLKDRLLAHFFAAFALERRRAFVKISNRRQRRCR